MTVQQDKHRLLRQQLWNIIHRDMGSLGHVYNFLLVALILLSLAIIPLQMVSSSRAVTGALWIIEVIVISLFTLDYAVRIYASPNRWRYLRSMHGIIDLASILPFYLGLFATPYFRAFRLLRLLQLFKLGNVEAAAAEEEHEDREQEMGLHHDERVEYVVTRHPLYLIVSCIPPIFATSVGIGVFLFFEANVIATAVAVCLCLFALIFLYKAWLDYSYDAIFITSNRLIFQLRHLLGRSINQVNYHTITNVKPYYPSILSYILRYGDLVVETPAAEQGHVILRCVWRHEHAAHIIMRKCFDAHVTPGPAKGPFNPPDPNR